jgi:hypothetical protein
VSIFSSIVKDTDEIDLDRESARRVKRLALDSTVAMISILYASIGKANSKDRR